jgi:hypothetical protein
MALAAVYLRRRADELVNQVWQAGVGGDELEVSYVSREFEVQGWVERHARFAECLSVSYRYVTGLDIQDIAVEPRKIRGRRV